MIIEKMKPFSKNGLLKNLEDKEYFLLYKKETNQIIYIQRRKEVFIITENVFNLTERVDKDCLIEESLMELQLLSLIHENYKILWNEDFSLDYGGEL
ncbi:hypothetical protein HS141_15885 [Cetobacterium somerae]|uniref:hypothetical protein n=1 Tax=Cetobacterium somerae TaxID=188913 RepID=UPI00211ECE78|nr:hypothetical protein [Cetobacterium somerae]MCQ9628399.1 hypothetical protein [Cetobacterium somerae]